MRAADGAGAASHAPCDTRAEAAKPLLELRIHTRKRELAVK